MENNKKLRIGLFTDVYYPFISGVVVAVDTLRKALEEQGHTVYIITMNTDLKTRRYIKKNNVLQIPGLPIGVMDFSVRVSYPYKAVKYIKDLNLDIIHSHTEFSMGLFAKSMAKKLGIPMVQTFHTLYEDAIDYVTKGYFPNTSRNILKVYMKKYFSKTISDIIVPTNKTKDFLKQRYHLKQNIHIIPNGIDTEKFYESNVSKNEIKKLRKKYGIDEDSFVVSWIGRLGYEKRVNYLIDGFKNVIKDKKNAKLLIVGTGPEEDNLKELVNDLELNNYVIFTGKVSYDEIYKYYNLSNVIASASHFETQGLTLIEAFSASRPVVVVHDKSFTPIVKNGFNGMIFKNKHEYAKAIEYLIDNKDIYEEMKKNSFIFSKNFSLQNFACKVIYVYEKALDNYTTNNNNDKSKYKIFKR